MNKLNKKVLIAILVALVLMTAVTGYYAYKLGRRADLSLNAKATDSLK